MKILSMKILNHKKISVFEKKLNGKNMHVAGKADQGKTTAISALWDLLKKVSEPLKKGEDSGQIVIHLGDMVEGESVKRVVCQRRFTEKSSTISIGSMDTDSGKLSVEKFKKFFSKLAINPHKIMDMGELEQTRLLLQGVKIPGGIEEIDLEELQNQRDRFAKQRQEAGRDLDRATKALGDKPEIVYEKKIELVMKEKNRLAVSKSEYDANLQDMESQIGVKTAAILDTVAKISQFKKKLVELEKELEATSRGVVDYQNNNDMDYEKEIAINDEEIIACQENNIKAEKYNLWAKNKNDLMLLKKYYDEITQNVTSCDEEKKKYVNSVMWPIDEIDIRDGRIYYQNIPLSQHGKSVQMLVCGAISASSISASDINVVMMDGIESMDKEHFDKLEKIFNDHSVQVLSSRVERADNYDSDEIVFVDGAENNKQTHSMDEDWKESSTITMSRLYGHE